MARAGGSSEHAERYERVAGQFAARVHAVPREGWTAPSPCEGWLAKDVVGHLVAWVPGFPLSTAGIPLPVLPAADDDPGAAWDALDTAIRAALADPETSARVLETPLGRITLAEAIETFVVPDLLVHTWDLARATGLDETLDADEVHRSLEAMEPMDEMLRQSGQFGPRVAVDDDADEQARLLAFTGRDPTRR